LVYLIASSTGRTERKGGGAGLAQENQPWFEDTEGGQEGAAKFLARILTRNRTWLRQWRSMFGTAVGTAEGGKGRTSGEVKIGTSTRLLGTASGKAETN